LSVGSKTKKKRAAGYVRSPITKTAAHPAIAAVDMPAAQAERFRHEVKAVPNPTGEVTIKGEIRQHKACRRVPIWQSLGGTKGIDKPVMLALEWYDERLGLAYSGLFKCGLDTSGSGGSHFSHVPASVAAVDARADVDFAHGFIPPDLCIILDRVMVDGETFEQIGARMWPTQSERTQRRKASTSFRLAANYLLLGVGRFLQTGG
jgi:hypothetical protein